MKAETPITTFMRGRARYLQDAILATGLERTPNYIESVHPDRFYIGYLGEFAVANWLAENQRKHVHRISTAGRSQPAEFLVYHEGQVQKLEVKTASEPFHRNCLVPVKQSLDFWMVVGVRLNGDVAEIWGAATRADVLTWPIETMPGRNIESRTWPLRDLPITPERFLALLDRCEPEA